jgi:PhnB protein
MQVEPYLYFNGQCEAALRFYEAQLGANIKLMMTYGESPMADQAPPGWGAKILHASWQVGLSELGAADVAPEAYQKPQGFMLSLSPNDPAEAERVFGELAKDGVVQLPLQETFWARRFGMVTDQFGVPWQINCEKAA